MNSDSKTNIKSLAAFAMIGYVCVLIVNFANGILVSALKMLGILFSINPKIYFFLDVIPEILEILFWIFIISKYLKTFSWSINLADDLPRKFAIRIGLTTLILFILLLVARYFERQMWASNITTYFPEKNLVETRFIISSILNFIEVVVIAFGFIRIFTKREVV